MRRDREDEERKQRLVEAVKRQRAISEGKKKEADFIHKFLQKKNTMTKNINIALHQIKSHQGEDDARKQVTDIKADIEEGTRLAMQNRVKTVSKEAHRHDVLKTDMKTIMEKAPLIVRNQWKLPVYPKINFNSTETSKFRESFTNSPSGKRHDREMNESKEGLVTETQMQIISGHVDKIEADR